MKRYILLLMLLMGASFIIQRLIIVSLLPTSDFALMPIIPLFFVILGIVTIKIVYSKPKASVIILLVVKSIKILLSLAFILLYVIFNKENTTAFLISLLVYFIIYLLFETWMLSAINKKN